MDERCAGYKIETAGGAKRTLLRILRLPAFFNTPFRHGAQTADRRRRGSPRSLSGGYGNMDRSIIPESHFEEAIRYRTSGNSVKFDTNGQIRWEPINQDWYLERRD